MVELGGSAAAEDGVVGFAGEEGGEERRGREEGEGPLGPAPTFAGGDEGAKDRAGWGLEQGDTWIQ